MTRNRLYLLLFLAITAGYAYMAWQLHNSKQHYAFTPCIIKNTTGIACPSCGTTRAIAALAQGNIAQALYINPFGFIVAAVMLIIPLWLVYDVASKKNTLHTAYLNTEKALTKKWIALPLILLVLANWAWNISKGL